MSLCILQGAGYLDGYNAGTNDARTGIAAVVGTDASSVQTKKLPAGNYKLTYGLSGYGNYIAHARVIIDGNTVINVQTPVQGNVGSYSLVYGTRSYTLTEEKEVTVDLYGYGANGMFSCAAFTKED